MWRQTDTSPYTQHGQPRAYSPILLRPSPTRLVLAHLRETELPPRFVIVSARMCVETLWVRGEAE
jgi:hypothetical protein